MTSVCVAFKAHLGWVNAVAVAIDAGAPAPVHIERVELLDTHDRTVREPYHVAGGWHGLERVARPRDPAEVIRRGRRAQTKSAKRCLAAFAGRLNAEGFRWTRGVMLTARGRMGDDLEGILGSHAHIHIAEGEAIRDAVRSALSALEVERVDQDEKRVLAECQRLLGRNVDDQLKAMRPSGIRSWNQELRLLCLAAWLNRK